MKYKRYLDLLARIRARWTRISLTKKRSVVAVLVFVIVALIVSLEVYPFGSSFVVGKAAPRSVRATRTVQFRDTARTRQEQDAAEAAVQDVYDVNSASRPTAQARTNELFSSVDEAVASPNPDKAAMVRNRVGPAVPQGLIDSLLAMTPEQRKQAQAASLSGISVLDGPVTQKGLVYAQERAKKLVDTATADPTARVAAEQIANTYIEPNATLNAVETAKRKKAVRDKVKPVVTTRLEGELIIKKGETVTPEVQSLLRSLGFASTTDTPYNLLLTILFALAIFILAVLYLYKERRHIYDSPGLLALLGGMVVIYTIVAKVLTLTATSTSSYWGYLMPTAAVALITAVLLDTNVAVMMVFVCSLITGVLYGGSFTIASFALLGGLFPALLVSHTSSRHQLRRASLYTSIWLAFVAFGITMMSPIRQDLALHSALGLLNGAICGVVAMGALPFLETTFRVTTNTWLLELASPEQEMLKDLSMQAPGTYSHSVMVANLSEAAAREVGSDPLLARVAAYYHDIGKIKRPQFFVENQPPGRNPHDNLSPNLSALIIISHVKDGVEILEKNHIPPDLVEIIKEHHGNSLVRYFYEKALESSEKGDVEESRFRYHFDRPHRRTAGILMLADSVEATAKTLERPSASQIEQMVDRIIGGKLEDGQMDDCELTFSDFKKVRDAFLKILISAYHPRVDYPLPSVLPAGRKKRASKGLGGTSSGVNGPAASPAKAPKMVAGLGPVEPRGTERGPG
jgi:cyclic-di-AMP phosphodiesterase PgpH